MGGKMEEPEKNERPPRNKLIIGCFLIFIVLFLVIFWGPSFYRYPDPEREIRSTARKFYNHAMAYFADDTNAHPNGKIIVGRDGPPGFEADSDVVITGGPMIDVGGHVYFKQPLFFTHKDYSRTFLLQANGDLEEFPVASFSRIEEHPDYKILLNVYDLKSRIIEDNLTVDFGVQEIEFLLNLMSHDFSTIREEAAWVLGEVKAEKAVAILIEELNYGGFREAAASALGKLRDPRAVEPLVDMIENSRDVLANRAAIYALGEIKDARAVEPLIKIREDKNRDGMSRIYAKDALEKITGLKLGRQSDSAELKSWIRRNTPTSFATLTDIDLTRKANEKQGTSTEKNESVSIVGTWTISVADTSCSETTEYHPDRTLTITGNQEIIKGEYIFYGTLYDDTRYKLTLSFTYDNGLPDCSGDTVDETDNVTDWYVEFFDDGKTMYLFNQPAHSDVALGPFSKTE